METWVRLGSSILEGDACVAPTQICPLQGRHGVRGRSTGGVFFFSVAMRIGHHLRKSDSGLPSGRHSWSMMVPFGGLYTKGDACVAPTQICPLQGRYGVRGRSMGGVSSSPAPLRIGHHVRKSAILPRSGRHSVRRRVDGSFWWSLHKGRRMRRPYTDMPATRPVRRAWAFYGRRFLLLRGH